MSQLQYFNLWLVVGVYVLPQLPNSPKSRSNSYEDGKEELLGIEILRQTVAYVIQNSKVGISWTEVKEAYAKILEEKCRNITQKTIAAMAQNLEWVGYNRNYCIITKNIKSLCVSRFCLIVLCYKYAATSVELPSASHKI